MPETPTFGRYAETPYDRMTPEQQDAYRSLIETRGRLPGPNKIWVDNPKLATFDTEQQADCFAGAWAKEAKSSTSDEFDVSDDRPQNHMAPITTHTSTVPQRLPSAVTRMCTKGLVAAAAAGRSWIARVMAISMANPATPDTSTEFTIAFGAASCAPTVSSATCADAS